jgi:hypothetical protein
VDVENLEGTPDPFKVKKASGMLSSKNTQERLFGFIIIMSVEPQDVFGMDGTTDSFDYKAIILSDNIIEITAPLLAHSEKGGLDEILRLEFGKRKEGHVLVNAMDNARLRYEKKTLGHAAPMKKYHLEFPKGVKLNAKTLMIHKDSELPNPKQLVVEGLSVTEQLLVNNEEDGERSVWLTKFFFRVADLAQDPELYGSTAKKKAKGTAAAAAMMGGSEN